MLLNPQEQPRMTKLAPIYDALFPSVTAAIRSSYADSHEPEEWTRSAEAAVWNLVKEPIEDETRRDIIQCTMTYYLLNVVDKIDDLQRWSEIGGLR